MTEATIHLPVARRHPLRSELVGEMARRRSLPEVIEQEIDSALRQHREQLDAPVAIDIGRLSADAVLAQYEQTALAIEEMGQSIKERVARLEASLRETDKDMKALAECAASIRDKGKHVHAQVDEANAVSKEVRELCAAFVKKVQ